MNIKFERGAPVPQALLHPSITPELQARMDALVTDLVAAGLAVAVLAVPASGGALTFVQGDARRLMPVLAGAHKVLHQATCPCPTCTAERNKTRGHA